MLNFYGMTVWIENIYRFSPQRQFDKGILQTFASDPDISVTDPILANELRMWMKRVIGISDVTTIDGTAVDWDKIKNGSEWRATSHTNAWIY